MLNRLKRNAVIGAVLVCVCAAVYLNWSYNSKWGTADQAMVEVEDAMMEEAMSSEAEEIVSTVAEYFAEARLTRQTSRAEALSLLEIAASSEGASQETINGAMDAISAMATYSMQESQVENLLLAKDFEDCVVYMSSSAVTVAVSAPIDGLDAAQVAQITEIIVSETDYTVEQLNVIEIRDTETVTETVEIMDLEEVVAE